MYRLLITDDESYIVEGLAEILENDDSLDLDIYKACSAYEAIGWMERTRIDILITDICMPGMNGMELLNKVKETWPACRVIFLTGHAEFDYACQAIRKNATGYIIKTEDDDVIIETVKKAIGEINDEARRIQLMEGFQEQIEGLLPIAQRDYLDLVLRGVHHQPEKMKAQFQTLKIPINPEREVLLLIGKVLHADSEIGSYDRMRNVHAIQMTMEYYTKHYISSVAIEHETNSLVWMLQAMKADAIHSHDDKMLVIVKENLELIQSVCKRNHDIDISFFLDDGPTEMQSLSSRLRRLLQIQQTHHHSSSDVVIHIANELDCAEYELISRNADYEKINKLLERQDLIYQSLRDGNREAFFGILWEIEDVLKKAVSKNDNTAQEIYYRLAMMLLSIINQKKLAEKLAFNISLHSLMRHDSFVDWQEAVSYLHGLAKHIFDLQNHQQKELLLNIVTFVKDYVVRHLGEDISLVKLSEVTGYNASYLSRLFKNSTGENLQLFIGRVRVEKAKELLLDNHMSIQTIVTKLGYDSRSYFNRFFKKTTGMTPMEYRNDHMSDAKHVINPAN